MNYKKIYDLFLENKQNSRLYQSNINGSFKNYSMFESQENSNYNSYKEVLWKDLKKVIQDSEIDLKIKILDPENVMLGNSNNSSTLGYIIKNSRVKLDFSPSDFSDSQFTSEIINMFSGCKNLVKMCKLPASITETYCMFDCCNSLVSVDTSNFTNVTEANGMFANCRSLVSVDTSNFTNVTEADSMFDFCSNLRHINTSVFTNTTSTRDMFRGCTALTSIDTSVFINDTDPEGMFNGCTSLTSIDIGAFSQAGRARFIFTGCTKLESVTNCSFDYYTRVEGTFRDCPSLKEITFGPNMDYSKQFKKYIRKNEADLSDAQIENAKMYSDESAIRFTNN